MKMIDNAGQWHKLWSMRFILATGFFSGVIAAYALLPPDWLPHIPGYVKRYLGLADMFCAGAAGISRVIKQQIGGK